MDNNIVERPTGLHLYIYLLERYFIGLPESQCCKGRYDRGGLEGFRLDDDVYYMDENPAYTASLAALKITGSPTSLYMANFWGHDENLMYDSSYIEGINHLYEFDCGKESGWMYKVNDWFPNYGCSAYTVESGDNIVWCYTCNGFGEDVGSTWATTEGSSAE